MKAFFVVPGLACGIQAAEPAVDSSKTMFPPFDYRPLQITVPEVRTFPRLSALRASGSSTADLRFAV